ncbi:MAG: bifunctional oligoribonuclease/PAP phosphatase NrnA [Candidatus Poribacteria bacterium]|nr:bifunctional oligoribonuclease/PAP phosphatase NrnA [Candidatus Poribacteria bacterium]
MTDSLTNAREDAFRATLDVFDRYDSFWLTSHIHPDPDAVGSVLAAAHWLRGMGKTVEVVLRDPAPRITHYLPGIEWILPEPSGEARQVLAVLDVANRDRLGSPLSKTLQPTGLILNIDHHATGEPFADVVCVFTDACATCELLYDLMTFAGSEITYETAQCLYSGIIGDTGNFRFSNTTPHTLEVAADLVRKGVQPNAAYEQLYGSRTEGQVQLLGMVLNTLRRHSNGDVATIRVTREMYQATGTTTEDVDGFSDYPRSVDGVKAVAFLGELKDGKIKVSLRSRDERVTVNGVAASFGGGGHAYAAGCILDAPIEDVERRVVTALTLAVKEATTES